HYLPPANVHPVLHPNIPPQPPDIHLPFHPRPPIHLPRTHLLQPLQISLNPKLIETPFIAGLPINGIQVKAKAPITLPPNIPTLLPPPPQQTIIPTLPQRILST
ncbi:flotillin-like FloA family protein, partial [Staphylococcus epidermidis]|uniref:flotillin-like FloA family protein n=1 Tax=Staphylococcus epidermidis TaxID=1282 RepID=UPI001643498B